MTPEHDNHDNDVRVEYRGTGFYVSLAIIFLAAVTLLILAVQNTDEVTVEILAFEFNLPLFAVILGTALVVVILDELIGLVWRRQRRTRLEERAELQRLRAEHKAQVDSATVEDESSDEPEEHTDEPEQHTDQPDRSSTPYSPSTSDSPDPSDPESDNSPT